MLPESSSLPKPAKTAHSRNLAHASLETAVHYLGLSTPLCILHKLVLQEKVHKPSLT